MAVGLMIGMAVAGGALSAWKGEEERKSQNDAIEAKKALIKKGIENKRAFFEFSTFTKYVDHQAAGAKRISQSLMATGGVRNAFAQKQVADLFLKRDVAIGRMGLEKEIEMMDLEIKNLNDMMEERSKSDMALNFLQGSITGFTQAAAMYDRKSTETGAAGSRS